MGVFLEKMKREGLSPDRLTYNTAIAAFAFGRQADMALSLLEEMNAVGLSPDAVNTSFSEPSIFFLKHAITTTWYLVYLYKSSSNNNNNNLGDACFKG